MTPLWISLDVVSTIIYRNYGIMEITVCNSLAWWSFSLDRHWSTLHITLHSIFQSNDFQIRFKIMAHNWTNDFKYKFAVLIWNSWFTIPFLKPVFQKNRPKSPQDFGPEVIYLSDIMYLQAHRIYIFLFWCVFIIAWPPTMQK